MSTIKISQLPQFPVINSNTANTLFVGVDIPSAQTFSFSAHTLAKGLFLNETLIVGNNTSLLPNTSAQFSLAGDSYVQTNFVNLNGGGTADHVITANNGTDSTYFLDLGFANPGYQAGSEFNNIGNSVDPLDGYLYVQGGTTPGVLGGNLIVGTTTSNTETRFIVSGGSSSNVIAKMTSVGFKLVNNNQLYFSDGTSQNTAAASNAYSQAAFALANTIVVTQSAINATQNATMASAFNTANSAASFANGAFTKANNALANTSGTFAGNLTLTGNLIASGIQSTSGPITTGNLIVNGTSSVSGTSNISGSLNVTGSVSMNATMVLANSNFNATESAVTISASPTVATPANDGYMIHISGKNGIPSRIVTDSYGTGAYAVYAGRAARGNVSNPTAVQAGDILSRFSGNGYGTTKYQSLGTGRIDFIAAENYTDANTGSQIKFWNCPTGSNTLTNIASFNGDSAVFTGVVNPQKGFIYTPRVLSGAQTAITIDFSSDSVIRATFAATLTNTPSNFTAGKVVEMWLTNTAGNGQTVVHGGLANNSTTGSTSSTVASGRSILLRYFSVVGDLANTFVAVTYG